MASLNKVYRNYGSGFMRTGFIGSGNIAGAIVSGIIKKEVVSPSDIYVFDVDSEKLSEFCSAKSVNACGSISEIVKNSDYIVLSVKPQNYRDVLDEIASQQLDGKVFVSVAAGISIDFVKSIIGKETKVVRVMPNTPLLLGEGATAACRDELVTDEEFERACSLFSCGGKLAVLDEAQMNAVIAVNGSSPAYLFLFAKAVCEYAKSVGIDEENAKILFAQTMIGSAKMITDSGDDLQTLIDKVTSKGGTTAAALNVFYEKGFTDCIEEAMAACTKRAEELGS